MLENESVRNLERQQTPAVAQWSQPNQIVYREQPATITSQPRPPATLNVHRIAIPVSTIQFDGGTQIPNPTPFIPRTGLDILRGIPSIHIHQTVELTENLTSVSSENRYSVRAPSNEAVYVATESSTRSHQMFFGSNRPFSMHILDRTNQEALTIRRNMSCGIFCCTCVPQNVEIWAPPGDLLGYVQEVYSFFGVEFTIQDSSLNILYQIEGPPSLTRCLPKETHFKVTRMDYTKAQIASITRIWNTDISSYTINIYFIDPEMDVRKKSLLLGAAFLIEYMFYQGRNSCS